MADPLTLINAFEVPSDQAEQFIAAWEKTRDYLSSQPGYVDTALHQAVSPSADFRFVNIGHWTAPRSSWRRRKAPASASRLRVWPGIGHTRVCTAWCGPDRLEVIGHGREEKPEFRAGRS